MKADALCTLLAMQLAGDEEKLSQVDNHSPFPRRLIKSKAGKAVAAHPHCHTAASITNNTEKLVAYIHTQSQRGVRVARSPLDSGFFLQRTSVLVSVTLVIHPGHENIHTSSSSNNNNEKQPP